MPPTSGNGRLIVTWTSTPTGANPVSEYVLNYTPAGGPTKTAIVKPAPVKVTYNLMNVKNGTEYTLSVTAKNSYNMPGLTSGTVTATPNNTKDAIDFTDMTTRLGEISEDYLYAEDVPVCDFYLPSRTVNSSNGRVSYSPGGRAGSDRIVRAKETALGNFFSDAVAWYARTGLGLDFDFAMLPGELPEANLVKGELTLGMLLSAVHSNYYDGNKLTVYEITGAQLYDHADTNETLFTHTSRSTFMGQIVDVQHTGHWGGGSTPNPSKGWGIPSSDIRYTIAYKAYSIADFNAYWAIYYAAYQAVKTYAQAVADDDSAWFNGIVGYLQHATGSATEKDDAAYKRGDIKTGTLTIDGEAVDPMRTYRILSTSNMHEYHAALIGKAKDNTDTLVWHALAAYIYEFGELIPYLDGRLSIEGGVPMGPSKYTP